MIKYLIFFSIAFIAYSNSVFACSCKGTNYSDDYFYSESVVIGEIDEVRPSSKKDTLEGILVITENLKGELTSNIKVYGHSFSSPSCAKKLIKGEYVLFIKNDEPIRISSCSSTQLIPNIRTKKYLVGLKENPPLKPSEKRWLGILDQSCQIDGDTMGEKCINGKWYWRGPDET